MTDALSCYRCGASLAALSLPFTRLDECPRCLVQLHVCRMCVHYAPQLTGACDEDDAIEVRDKHRANFCDYFKPSPNAFEAQDRQAEVEAREKLASLFGSEDSGAARQNAGGEPAPSAQEQARADAESLFKK